MMAHRGSREIAEDFEFRVGGFILSVRDSRPMGLIGSGARLRGDAKESSATAARNRRRARHGSRS